MRKISVLAVCLAGLTLTACGGGGREQVALGETYNLINENGRMSGRVVFTPLGDGNVYDRDGHLVGRVVKP